LAFTASSSSGAPDKLYWCAILVRVAAELFLGVRTVETHLSHIYVKLGVRSRTELSRVYDRHV